MPEVWSEAECEVTVQLMKLIQAYVKRQNLILNELLKQYNIRRKYRSNDKLAEFSLEFDDENVFSKHMLIAHPTRYSC